MSQRIKLLVSKLNKQNIKVESVTPATDEYDASIKVPGYEIQVCQDGGLALMADSDSAYWHDVNFKRMVGIIKGLEF